MPETYDRAAQDVGNIISLEHVNTRVDDQTRAHLFYVTGMGFTRDPYIDFGLRNMWINLGRQQFHLPIGEPQVLRGSTGVVVPGLDALHERLERVAKQLDGTAFAFSRVNGHLAVSCPWGNQIEVHEAGNFGAMQLGMPYVRLDVPAGTAAPIARFYREILGAPATVTEDNDGVVARVEIGNDQTLQYRESDNVSPTYDGHHVAIYIADFSGPYNKLMERGLVSRESNEVEYRFQSIVDLDSGASVFEIEHEVRSITHPLFARPLVNRNPAQTNQNYVRGHDAFQV
jgi:hypothetical protein